MDVLRKILFGGLRSTDTNTKTVLELSFVPRNSQAFVKFYNGDDLNRLTPFNYAEGITLCRRHENTTTATAVSQSTTLLPVLRTARGNYLLWNMTEVRTCNWAEEIGYTLEGRHRRLHDRQLPGRRRHCDAPDPCLPRLRRNRHPAEYIARVEVCKPSLLGDESCKQYPFGNYKPRGLLHEFGESDNFGNKAARAEFALMLGSFDSNLRGGILRKNMSEINDEINPATGLFLGTAGIISGAQQAAAVRLQPEQRQLHRRPAIRAASATAIARPGAIPSAKCWSRACATTPASRSTSPPPAPRTPSSGSPPPTWSDPLTANRTYASGKTRADAVRQEPVPAAQHGDDLQRRSAPSTTTTSTPRSPRSVRHQRVFLHPADRRQGRRQRNPPDRQHRRHQRRPVHRQERHRPVDAERPVPGSPELQGHLPGRGRGVLEPRQQGPHRPRRCRPTPTRTR